MIPAWAALLIIAPALMLWGHWVYVAIKDLRNYDE